MSRLRSEGVLRENVVRDKSKAFALRIIRMYQFLCSEKKEFVLSKQVLRSGTSIGANVREGDRAQSKAEFIAKINIALKEADETQYWLELFYESGTISEAMFTSMNQDCEELIRLLVSIIKSTHQSRSTKQPTKS